MGYPNLELHFIDDGSTDRSFDIALEWRERHTHRLPGGIHMARQANEGLTRTLNRLTARAKGEFITMLASDDALLAGASGHAWLPAVALGSACGDR